MRRALQLSGAGRSSYIDCPAGCFDSAGASQSASRELSSNVPQRLISRRREELEVVEEWWLLKEICKLERPDSRRVIGREPCGATRA